MNDNVVINPGSGGSPIRTLDRGTGSNSPPDVQTQVVGLDVGGEGTGNESLVSDSNPMPVVDITSHNPDTPNQVAIIGDPDGDFAGVRLLEAVIDEDSSLRLGVNAGSQGAGPADQKTLRTVQSDRDFGDLLIIGPSGQIAAGLNVLGPGNRPGPAAIDVTGYRSISIQFNPIGTVSSGTINFEGSNDGITFVALGLIDEANQISSGVTTFNPTTGTSRFFKGPISWKFIRARISTAIGGGGSVAAITRLSQVPWASDSLSVVQSTATSLNVTLGTGTNAAGKFYPLPVIGAGSGLSGLRFTSALATTGVVKGSAGNVYAYDFLNTAASIRYVHFYNQTTAPTLGTSTPTYTVGIPAGARVALELNTGLVSGSAGLAYGITTDNVAIPATAATAGDVQGSVSFG